MSCFISLDFFRIFSGTLQFCDDVLIFCDDVLIFCDDVLIFCDDVLIFCDDVLIYCSVIILCFFLPCHVTCGILIPQPGVEPRPWQWQHWVLTPEPPGSSQVLYPLCQALVGPSYSGSSCPSVLFWKFSFIISLLTLLFFLSSLSGNYCIFVCFSAVAETLFAYIKKFLLSCIPFSVTICFIDKKLYCSSSTGTMSSFIFWRY